MVYTNKLFRFKFILIAFMMAYVSLGLWEENRYKDIFNDEWALNYFCEFNPLHCNKTVFFDYYTNNITLDYENFREEQPETFRIEWQRKLLYSFFPIIIFWFLFINIDLIKSGYDQVKTGYMAYKYLK